MILTIILIVLGCELIISASDINDQLPLIDYLKRPTLGDAQYLEKTSGCIRQFYESRSVQGNPPRYCRMNNIQSLVPSSTTVLPKCNFYVDKYSMEGDLLTIDVQHQWNCNYKGSSFTVQFQGSEMHYVWCDSFYIQESSLYRLTCVMSHSLIQGCGSLHVFLDYEEYNAYREQGSPLLPLDRLLNFTSEKSMFLCVPGLTKLNTKPVSAVDVRSCLNQHPVYMIGSSHMRYNWDAIVTSYLDGMPTLVSLAQHHGDASVDQVHFISNLFVMQLPTLLDAICNTVHDALDADQSGTATSRRWRVVIESLSWDLDYHPVRNVLIYNHSVPALIKAVGHMASRRCGQSMCGLHYTCAQHKGRKQQSTKTVEILHTPGGRAVIEGILQSVCTTKIV